MTIAFMAFFCAILAEHFDHQLGLKLLYFALFIGVSSVIYWHISESFGRGDLRPYALVQFLPLLLIPVIIAIKPKPYTHIKWVWLFVGCYGLAKVLEFFDLSIFLHTGFSGHSLKHMAAALGVYFYLYYLTQRKHMV